MTDEPVPQRIGDAERDRAVDLLREHMAAGRLTTDEFEERLDVALAARTSVELDPLFSDLPGPKPGQGMATTAPFQTPPWQGAAVAAPAPQPVPEPVRGDGRSALAVITGIMWPITILAITFVPGLGWGHFWWLVFIPIVISSVLGKDTHERRERERQRIERDQRDLDRRRRALGDGTDRDR